MGMAVQGAVPYVAAAPITVPAPAAGCDFAGHPGAAGRQFAALPLRVQYAAVTLCNDGILPGTAKDLFSPQAPVTRAQAVRATIRTLAVRLTTASEPTYPDVSVNSPYYLYIETAASLGLVPFAKAGSPFDPSQGIQRQEMAALAVAALGDQQAAAALATQATPYADDAAIAAAYRGDVNEALALGILTPYDARRLDPAGVLDRAGLALALVRMQYQLQLAAPAAVSLAASPAAIGVGSAAVLTPTYTTAAGKTVTAASLGGAFSVAYRVSPSGAQVGLGPDGSASFVASAPGTYTVTATVSGGGLASPISGSVQVSVYGAPAQLALSAPSSIVADGASTARVTAVVQDANGDPVADSAAPITLAIESNGAVGLAPGQAATVAATSGSATFTVQATLNAGRTDTLTVTSPGLASATAQISSALPVPTSLSLTAAQTSVSVDAVSPDAVSAMVLDQSGNPLPEGTVPVTFSLTGDGTFGVGTAATESATYVGEGSAAPVPATVEVYSELGVTGTITVSASASGLTGSSLTLNAVVTGPPRSLIVSATEPGTAAGATAGQTGTPAQVTVTAVDANGVPVPVAEADPVTLTFAQGLDFGTTLSVGPSAGTTIPSGAASVIIPVASESAGTFAFTATDAAGLASATGKVTLTAGPVAQLTVSPDPMPAGELLATGGGPLLPSPLHGTDWQAFSLANTVARYTSVFRNVPYGATSPSGVTPYLPFVSAAAAPVVFTAQAADANGNPVAEAGLGVTFTLTPGGEYFNTAPVPDTGSAALTAGGVTQSTTPGSLSATASATAVTNAQGQATATVQVAPDPGDAYYLGAAAGAVQLPLPVAIVSRSLPAAAMQLTPHLASAPDPFTATPGPVSYSVPVNPQQVLSIAVAESGADGAVASEGDILTATATSGALLGAMAPDPEGSPEAGSPNYFYPASTPASVTFPWSVGTQLLFEGTRAGAATVTVTDDSAPTTLGASVNLEVTPGPPFQVVDAGPNATAPYPVTAPGVYGPFNLTVADVGGDPVVDQAPITLTAQQVDQILGAPAGTPVRTASTGTNLVGTQTLTIAAGTGVLPVWIELDSAPTTLGQASTFIGPFAQGECPVNAGGAGPYGLVYGCVDLVTTLSILDPVAEFQVTPGPTPGVLGGAQIRVLFTTPVIPPPGQTVQPFGVTSSAGGSLSLTSGIDTAAELLGAFGADDQTSLPPVVSPDGQSYTWQIPADDTTAVQTEPTSGIWTAPSTFQNLAFAPLAGSGPVPVSGSF
jgi:hypothetical protein